MQYLLASLQLSNRPSLSDNFVYQLTGFAVVMVVLISIWLVIEIVGAVFRHIAQEKLAVAGPPGAPPTPSPTPSPKSAAATPTDILFVIAAAVHATMQGPYRIVSIHETHPHEHASPDVMAWSVEGRRQIFSSHHVR